MEKWKSAECIGLSLYLVSNLGRIKRKCAKRCCFNPKPTPGGYLQSVFRCDDGKRRGKFHHTIVASVFLHKPNESHNTVDHINRNPADNRVMNLRWATWKTQAANKSSPVKNEDTLRRVNQLDLDGKFIRSWLLKDARNAFNTRISTACSQGSTCGGFKWEYAVDENAEWRSVVPEDGFDSVLVSNLGQVRLKRGVTYGHESVDGYRCVDLKFCNGDRKVFRVHRLVASAFLDPPEETEATFVNHKDGVKTNNAAKNLAWVTHTENIRHAYEHGLIRNRVKPVLQIDKQDGSVICRFSSTVQAGQVTGINCKNISAACLGKQCQSAGGYCWKYGM